MFRKHLALLALAFLPALGASALDGMALRHFEDGLALAEKGRFVDAGRELDVALSLAPDSDTVKKAREAIRRGELPGGLEEKQDEARLAAGKTLAAGKAGLALGQARKAYRASRLKEAEEAWRRALVLDPGNTEARRGLDRLALEKYRADADQPFDQTIAELYDLALREMRKERYVEAKAKLEEALKLNPTQGQVKRLMAEVETAALVQQGERSAAAMCEHGESLLREESLAEARKAFQRALDEDPASRCARDGLARQAVEAGPVASALLDKGRRAEKAGRAVEAEGWYAEALDLLPGLEKARKGLQRASGAALRARSQAKTRAEATRWYNDGVEAWEAGRLADAAAAFKEVIQINPADQDAPKALKKVQARLDAQAGDAAREAGRLYEKGKELEKRGQMEEALASYRKALSRDPSHAQAKTAAGRLEGELKD